MARNRTKWGDNPQMGLFGFWNRLRRRGRAAEPLHGAPGTSPLLGLVRAAQRFRLELLIVIAAGALAASVCGLVLYVVVRGYHEAIASAEHQVQDFVDILAAHATLVFDDVDRTLLTANNARRRLLQEGRWGAAAGLAPHMTLRELQQGSADIVNLSWTDERGERLYTSLSPTPSPLNLADQAYFIESRDRADRGLSIAPLVPSAEQGMHLVPLVRRFETPDGRFGGVTTALVDPANIATFFQTTTQRQRLVILLALRDGTVIVREPAASGVSGKPLPSQPRFVGMLSESGEGVYSSVSQIDGVERIAAFKALDGLPLVLTIAMDRSHAVAGWLENARILGVFTILLVAAIGGGALLMVVRIRQQAERQREIDAANEEISRARKLQALGTLVGGISHEVNNALVPVVMIGEAVRETLPEGSFERDSMGELLEAVAKIDQLMKRVVSFDRADREATGEVDLAELVTQLLTSLKATLPPNIDLVGKVSHGAGSVRADRGKLEQVLSGLVENAGEAIGIRAGRVEIDVDLDPADSLHARGGSSFARLRVSDDGPGMRPEVKERLFEPFFTTKEAGGGVGLGLYVIRRMINEFGGSLSVESELGRGTRFTVHLPRVTGGTAAADHSQASRA